MDYAVPYTKQRLTGRGYFFPTATPTQGADLGNLNMFKADFGIKRKPHYAARRGILKTDRQDAYGSEGVWTFTLDEFVTPTLRYAWGGTPNANFVQSSQVGGTITFTTASKKGGVFDIGKYGLFNASLTTPGSKVEGATQGTGDYFIDRGAGKLYIPLSSTIADATTLIVTYSCPALTYDSINTLSNLNTPGIIEVHGEDDSGQGKDATATDAVPPSRVIVTVPCILSVDDSGDFKPDDYRAITMKATETGQTVMRQLQ
jgi:hypothetical protein